MYPVRSNQRMLVTWLVVAFAASVLLLGNATRASAALGTPCAVSADNPTTNGVQAYGRGAIDCDSPEPQAQKIEARLMLSVFTWWEQKAYNSNNGPTYAVLGATATYVCNGTGTKTYRTEAKGWDVNGDWSNWTPSASRTFTC